MKLTLLVAQYRQAYEDTRIKLQHAIRINEEMIKTFELQTQIIDEMKAKISSMKKDMIHLKSHNGDNTVPVPPSSNNSTPTTFIEMSSEDFNNSQKATS